MIQVDILDSCPVFMHGLAHILGSAGMRVLRTRSEPGLPTDCGIDVSLVGPDALTPHAATSYISDLAGISRVLLITGDVDSSYERALLHAGALGLLHRQDPPETIVEAVRTTAAGDRLSHSILAGPGTQAPITEINDPNRSPGALSEREEQVLGQISVGLTHSQVARRLGISKHTVDTYVKRIRSKLGVGNKAELTRAAVLGNFIPAA